MRLLTRFELASRSVPDLQALLSGAYDAMIKSEFNSQDRRSALANVENVLAELADRHSAQNLAL